VQPLHRRRAHNSRTDDPLLEVVRRRSRRDPAAPRGSLVEALIERVCRLRPATVEVATSAAETPPTGDAHVDDPSGISTSWTRAAPCELASIASYPVLEVLGGGGMGIVFRRTISVSSGQVALKIMKAVAGLERGRPPALPARGEGAGLPCSTTTSSRLPGRRAPRHPVFGHAVAVGAESLHDRSAGRGHPAGSRGLRIGREVALGLGAAHAKGLIQPRRQSRPTSGSDAEAGGRVKILDFGLVRPAEDNAGLTRDQRLGTL